MIGKLKEYFTATPDRKEKPRDPKVAACALFLEIAAADHEFSREEQKNILNIMKKDFGVAEEEAEELVSQAQKELDGSVDLWNFTSLINENFSKEEKKGVMEMVWRVVYADGVMDPHEEYLARKLAQLLRLKHHEMIEAKLKAREKR